MYNHDIRQPHLWATEWVQITLPYVGTLKNAEVVHHFGFRSQETLNCITSSGIWGPTRHLPLKITNSLAILRLRNPLKTSTRLVGHGIWTRDLPNASLVRYHGVLPCCFTNDICCGLGVTSLSLKQQVWVWSPVGSVSWLKFFLGFSSTVREMSGTLDHIHPQVSFGYHNHLKPHSSICGWRWSLTLDVVHGSLWINNINQSFTNWRIGWKNVVSYI